MAFLSCKTTIVKPPQAVRKLVPDLIRDGLKFLMLQWHNDTLPKHFRQEAPTKWHYDKRTEKYQRRKERMRLQPLMFSGESRRRLLGSISITFTGKHPVKATGRFDAPRYFWMRPKGHPDKGGEFMRMNYDEWAGIAERLNNFVWQKIDEIEMTEYYGFDYH
jgi:hypothetical protein